MLTACPLRWETHLLESPSVLWTQEQPLKRLYLTCRWLQAITSSTEPVLYFRLAVRNH